MLTSIAGLSKRIIELFDSLEYYAHSLCSPPRIETALVADLLMRPTLNSPFVDFVDGVAMLFEICLRLTGADVCGMQTS